MMNQLVQIKCPIRTVSLLVCAVTLLAGCDLQADHSPEGYNLDKGEQMNLGKTLNEISGICYNTEDSSLLSISDSRRRVIRINLNKFKLKDYTGEVVPPDSDLEDIAKVDSFLYLLSSKGIIYEVPLKAKDSSGIKSYLFPSEKTNDFETLYYDPSVQGLVMMCKNCAEDKGKHSRSAYLFNLKTKSFDTTAYFTIGTDEVKKILKDDNAKFDPSAAAIHPINKRLYILSSAGNLLVITDTHGKLISAYKLNPDKFPQAEGIAFAPDGKMFITNEGKFDKATLQAFPFQNGTK